jgi:carbamoyltransferase
MAVSWGDLTIIECHNSTRHDSAVAVLHRGTIHALAAERIDRVKHSADPTASYEHLKRTVLRGVRPDAIHDYFDASYRSHDRIHHHLGHAASAFYASPFDDAAVLIVDGMGPSEEGNTTSTSLWHGKGTELTMLRSISQKGICYRSLGHFYAAVSYYLGFAFYDVSHTMSIAAYGDPRPYSAAMARLIWPTSDGLFDTDWEFIRYATFVRFGRDFGWQENPAQLAAWERRYAAMLGPMRPPGAPIGKHHCDIAAAAQAHLEATLSGLLALLHAMTRSQSLCYSGGVALNCTANGRTLTKGPFSKIFIQPAAGDDGQALGRLLFRAHHDFGVKQRIAMKNTFLGPSYTEGDLTRALAASERHLVSTRLLPRHLVAETASRLASGQLIGWFQGRSEYGPRALGHRSVLGDPRDPETPERISRRFKRREWYRPFAPSLLSSQTARYFKAGQGSPFMLTTMTAHSTVRASLPAVLHVDGSARVQTVAEDGSPYHELLKAFEAQTGVPVLLNTSFNPPGEPIVETPEHAVQAFLSSGLDALVLGCWLVVRRSG